MINKEETVLKAFNRVMGTDYKSIEINKSEIPEWDSMKHAELIIQLQKIFHKKFEILEVIQIQNLKDFLKLL